MKRWLARLRSAWLLCIALPLVSVGVAFIFEPTDGARALENLLYDVRLRSFNQSPGRSRDIVILALDDVTIQDISRNRQYSRNYGNYPYSRRLWARVLDHLMNEGARAVVLDSVMDEADLSPDNDLALGQMISERKVPFYIGFDLTQRGDEMPRRVEARNRYPGDPELELPETPDDADGDPFAASSAQAPLTDTQRLQALVFPVQAQGVSLPELVQYIPRTVYRKPTPPIEPVIRTAAGFGLVLPEQDSDGRLRRTHFAYTDGANTYVTLPVAVAADLLHADRLELAPGRLRLGSREIAINKEGDAELDFGGTLYERFDRISLVRVLNDWDSVRRHEPKLVPEGTFRGKVVLMGAFALGTYDTKSTPFAGETVGVTKEASELESLLVGGFIVQVPRWQVYGFTLFFSLLATLVILSTRSILVELTFPIAALGLLFVGTGLLLARQKLHVPWVAPATALTFVGLASVTFNHLFANREREQLRAIFSRFLARQVADQLAEGGELPRLDGESREITAFFSDIRSFSTFSEGFRDNPRGLVKLLNTYLTRVSGVLQDHGACLDKYIGDAVVCIFGAPVRNPNHAIDACRAALKVQEAIAQLRVEFAAQGLPDVYTRVGMNTAVMFVGNFGSEQLFSYTAMGDGMNLASRLEGANKAFGSLIMIGPRTYEMAQAHIEARELDWIRVAGKTEAVAVYELLAWKGKLSPVKRNVIDLYAQGLARYRESRFAEALEVFRRAGALDADDGPTETMIERCEAFLASPPKMPFDGVAKLEK